MTLGKVIQAARKQAGMTQNELGKKLGVSGSMIGQWENDLRNPKPETVGRIVDALGKPFLDLFLKYDKENTEGVNYKLAEIRKETEAIDKNLSISNEKNFQQKAMSFVASPIGRTIIDAFFDLNEYGQGEAMDRVVELTFLPWLNSEEIPEEWEKYAKERYAHKQSHTKDFGPSTKNEGIPQPDTLIATSGDDGKPDKE